MTRFSKKPIIKKIYIETPTYDIDSKWPQLKLLYKRLIELEDEHIEAYKEFYTTIFWLCDENCEFFLQDRKTFKSALKSQIDNINTAMYKQ